MARWRVSPRRSSSRGVSVTNALATAFLSVITVGDASAGPISFEPSVPVNPPQVYLENEQVATDRTGTWIAAGTTIIDYDTDTSAVLYMRSTDNARSWSDVQHIDADAYQFSSLRLATNYAGTWIMVWVGADRRSIRYVRSLDNGASWSASQLLYTTDTGPPSSWPGDPWVAFATDANGSWIVLLSQWTAYDNWSVRALRSLDDGATWSAPATILEAPGLGGLSLAASSAGTWMAIVDMEVEGLRRDRLLRSSDGGDTWITSHEAPGWNGSGLATDGAGTWIYAYVPWDFHARLLRSSDDGITWSTPAALDPYESLPGSEQSAGVRILYDPHGARWFAAWTVPGGYGFFGTNPELVFSVSHDGSATWERPVAVRGGAGNRKGGISGGYDFATDGAGTFVALFDARNDWKVDQSSVVSTSREDCPTIPTPGCKQLGVTGSSRLKVMRSGSSANALQWKWTRGAATSDADVGDPMLTTQYSLCLYDTAAGVPSLVFEKDVMPARDCSGSPCWEHTAKGRLYLDSARLVSAVKKLDLRPGVDGRASVSLQASGESLGAPLLPFVADPSVTVQLVNHENGTCWEASYNTSVRNTSSTFTARTP